MKECLHPLIYILVVRLTRPAKRTNGVSQGENVDEDGSGLEFLRLLLKERNFNEKMWGRG